MNIFATDIGEGTSARNLPDILVNKMILESAQLLTTAHVVLDGSVMTYKKTHENHPCAVWVRDNRCNYRWLYWHFRALLEEFKYRTGKDHACIKLIHELYQSPRRCPSGIATPPPKCMPEEYKVDCVYQSYKNYLTAKYAGWATRDKPIYVKWTKRLAPDWLPQYKQASRGARVVQLKRL